jgi:BMFP domain-containing protein YqiC
LQYLKKGVTKDMKKILPVLGLFLVNVASTMEIPGEEASVLSDVGFQRNFLEELRALESRIGELRARVDTADQESFSEEFGVLEIQMEELSARVDAASAEERTGRKKILDETHKVLKPVGKAAESVGREVGKAAESAGREVRRFFRKF